MRALPLNTLELVSKFYIIQNMIKLILRCFANLYSNLNTYTDMKEEKISLDKIKLNIALESNQIVETCSKQGNNFLEVLKIIEVSLT